MRVLHVVPSLLPESGGPSRTVPDLCRALAAGGLDVTLFSTHAAGNGLTIDPGQEPYEIVLLPAANGSLRSGRQIYKAICRRAGEFEVIHLHSMWNFVVTFGSAAARRARVPYVLAPRGMLSDACLRQSSYPLKRAFARAYDHRTVEGASRLHFLNHDEYLASQNDWFRYPPYFLARNGIDLNLKGVRPGMFRERYPELGGRRIMLFLGRLHAIKRLDLQLQALPQLLAEFPDLIWVLVGPDDGEWPRLKSLIDKAGLAAHVKWVGSIVSEERFSGLLDADVVVQTSFYECQSTTVNEALAVGAPLVVTDSINYGEVQASGAGYVVCSEPVELGQAIAAVLRAPDAAALMRRAGQRFAKEELAWTRIARTVSDAYVEIKSLRSEACEAWPNTSDASTART